MTKITVPSQHNLSAERQPGTPAPEPVRWALRLLWLCFTLGVVQYLSGIAGAVKVMPENEMARGALMFGLATPLVLFLFDAYLNIKISHGKNWARVAKGVLVLSSLFFQLAFSPSSSGFELALAVVMNILSFGALYLLFTKPGRQWFD
ncbi:MAG TPA: hypothetical protein VN089_09235 [Duganella sp.]|nr:hypothetical protein [Duganella sp.]